MMRTTLALDDDLLKKAQSFTGPIGPTELIREALKAFIQRESARRLAFYESIGFVASHDSMKLHLLS